MIMGSHNTSMDATLIFLLVMHLVSFSAEVKAHALEARSYWESMNSTIYVKGQNRTYSPKRAAVIGISHMFHKNSTFIPKGCDELCVGRIRSKRLSRFLQSRMDRGRNLASATTISTIWLNAQKVIDWFVKIDVSSTEDDEQEVMLVPDTGSFFTWFQCKPCQKCYPQRRPVYDKDADVGGYRGLNQGDEYCQSVQKTFFQDHMSPENCTYNAQYSDSTSSYGAVAQSNFRLHNFHGPDFTFLRNVGFGCGYRNSAGSGSGFSGVLGLSRVEGVSFPEQLSTVLGESFAFCLPIAGSLPDSGFLVLGDDAIPGPAYEGYRSVDFPSGGHDFFFYLDAVDMFVGERRARIPGGTFNIRPDRDGGLIIDSGQMLTSLMPEAFVPFRDEFRAAMRPILGEVQFGGKFGMDTCYDVTNIELETLPLPTTGFLLRNGRRFQFGRIASYFTYYTAAGRPIFCLPVTSFRPPSGISVLGGYQLMQTHMAFDHVHSRLTWRGDVC